MGFKAFLDINILVDFVDKTRKEHSNANLLFVSLANGKLDGYISESIINTTSYLTSKLTTVENFCLFVQDTLQILKILPCTNANVLQACKIARNDFEDAVLYRIALSNKLDFFITNDKKEFSKIAHPNLKVVSAKETLALL